MLDFSEISIADRGVFDEKIHAQNSKASEMTFTNFFMWRIAHGYRYTMIHGLLCVESHPVEGEPHLYAPVGDAPLEVRREAARLFAEDFRNRGFRPVFHRVTEENLGIFGENPLESGCAVADRDNSDYVYLREDLVHLKGKKYDGKRNHLHKFHKMYPEHSMEVLDPKLHMDDCERIMLRWCQERNCEEQPSFCRERRANRELLQNYEALACRGAIVRVDGVCEAFTVGEKAAHDTAIIHIEKAHSGMNGLYPFVNQQFCETAWEDVTFINREQDLGVEGLRRAKMSYHPAYLVDKFTCTFEP